MPDQLEEALGATPPASVLALSDALRDRLAEQVTRACAQQRALTEQSVDKALKGVPLPVRGVVRKALT